MKEKMKIWFGDAVKVLKSSRVYTILGGGAMITFLTRVSGVSAGIIITGMICVTMLGLAYIASETIRKK